MRRFITTAFAALAVLAVTVSAAPATGSGRILFQSFAPNGGDTLYTMGQDGSDVQRLQLNIPGSAISPDWSPDGNRVTFTVVVGDAQSIWTADADDKNAQELFHCAGACLGTDYPAWSPDGKSIAFTYYNSNPPPTAGPPLGRLDPRDRPEHAEGTNSRSVDLPDARRPRPLVAG
jgi:Tol biopolymer transport system component